MADEAKLEPGWLTRDVNNAASRAKSLEAAASSDKRKEAPPSEQQQQSVGSSTSSALGR
jgi:hypothetical protein